jgi:hypothetical protein
MNLGPARQTFLRIWNFLRRAPIHDAPTSAHEGQVAADRRRFWINFREGEREAEAACLEAETRRLLTQRP